MTPEQLTEDRRIIDAATKMPCEHYDCGQDAAGYYLWGNPIGQAGFLCHKHAELLWQKCSPAVKDRMIIITVEEALKRSAENGKGAKP